MAILTIIPEILGQDIDAETAGKVVGETDSGDIAPDVEETSSTKNPPAPELTPLEKARKDQERRRRLAKALKDANGDPRKVPPELFDDLDEKETPGATPLEDAQNTQVVENEANKSDVIKQIEEKTPEKKEKEQKSKKTIKEGLSEELKNKLNEMTNVLYEIQVNTNLTYEAIKKSNENLISALEEVVLNEKSEQLKDPSGGNGFSDLLSGGKKKSGGIGGLITTALLGAAVAIGGMFKQIEKFVKDWIVDPIERTTKKIEEWWAGIDKWITKVTGIDPANKDQKKQFEENQHKAEKMYNDFNNDPLTDKINNWMSRNLGITGTEKIPQNTTVSKDFTKQFEGYSEKAYKDGKNSYSIGRGHNLEKDKEKGFLQIGNTKIDYEDVLKNGLTKDQVEELYQQDLAIREKDLSKIKGYEKLDTNKKTALMDFYFNAGYIPNAVKKAIAIGDDEGVAKSLATSALTGKMGDKTIDLSARRQQEAALYMTPVENKIQNLQSGYAENKPIVNVTVPPIKVPPIQIPQSPSTTIPNVGNVPFPTIKSNAYDYLNYWDVGFNPA